MPSTNVLDQPRRLAAVLVAASLAALSAGLFTQHVLGYEPCSLCVLQRLGFIGVLGAAILLVGLPGASALSVVLAGILTVMALGGLGVASYQVWLQAFPPPETACGRGIAGYFDGMPFEDAFKWLLAADGDCAKPVSPFGFISLAQLGLVAFLLVSAAALRLLWLTANDARDRWPARDSLADRTA